MRLEEMVGNTYEVVVRKGKTKGRGDNMLYVEGYSLVFRRKRSPAWASLNLYIEPEVIEALKKFARQKGITLGNLIYQIVMDDSIPLVDIGRKEGTKKQKAGISIRREQMQELQQKKTSLPLQTFVRQKLYGWYFSQNP